jgi:heat shock protein HtpX
MISVSLGRAAALGVALSRRLEPGSRNPHLRIMSPERLFAHKLRNDLQPAALTALLALLCAYLAWFVGGPVLGWGAIAAVAALYFANPAASPRLVMTPYQGRAISPAESPRLDGILSELSRRAGLDRPPGLYYLPTRLMNASSPQGGARTP